MYAEGTAFNVQLLTALSLDSLNLLSQPFRGAVSEDVLGRAALCSLRPRTKRPGGTPKPQDKGTLPGGQSPARSHRLQPRQPALPPVSSAQSRRRPAGARPGALPPPPPGAAALEVPQSPAVPWSWASAGPAGGPHSRSPASHHL